MECGSTAENPFENFLGTHRRSLAKNYLCREYPVEFMTECKKDALFWDFGTFNSGILGKYR
jgi:hypothetical protein